jgi:cystathionine beta-synthase
MDNKYLNKHDNLLSLIGCTPLVRLNSLTAEFPGKYYVKYEAQNPGQSSKDRIAIHIIEKAERDGILKPGDTIIETTSGNTGFSIAMTATIKGYKCILAVSSKSSQDKIDLLKTMGAEVHVCPSNVPPEDPRSYYEVAKKIHEKVKPSIYINQYFNSLNTDAHYLTTGPEIWKQTEGEITHLIACSGTGGTISGSARYLKEQNPNIKILGIDAYGSVLKKYHETGKLDKNEIYSYRIEGLGKNLIPSATDFDVIDKFTKVTDKDAALMARKIAVTEGMFVGYTSGAAMQGTIQLEEEGVFNKDSYVVIIFPDHGSRYTSKIYSDVWMKEQGFLEKNGKPVNNKVEEFHKI